MDCQSDVIHLNREISLPRQVRLSRPEPPRSWSTPRLNLTLIHCNTFLPFSATVSMHTVNSAPSLSDCATLYRWRSPSGVHRHRAISPQGKVARVTWRCWVFSCHLYDRPDQIIGGPLPHLIQIYNNTNYTTRGCNKRSRKISLYFFTFAAHPVRHHVTTPAKVARRRDL